jgi:arylsulfatase
MEIYAGFLEHTDHHVGRVIDAIESVGALDDTLIFYILGDNGASAEGTLRGCFNEMTTLNGMPGIETDEFLLSKIDDFGTPDAYNHYAVGWAHAMCTPYQWTKQIASHWGGTRNGTVVHWPRGITAKGEIRNQFHHVIDVAPTVLAAAGLPAPSSVNGVAQAPLEGFSMLDSFGAGHAAESHTIQYFEMFGNRGLYHEGWTAVTRHNIPWTTDPPPAFDDDVWELYGPDDWTQSRDLAAQRPDKLAELQRLWMIEAAKYNVLPLDDRRYERINPDLAGRPQLIVGTRQVLYPGMRVTEATALNMKNKSHAITAQVTVPEGGADGVIVAQGGQVGGWAFYVHDHLLKYCFNFFGIEHYITASDEPVPTGDRQLRVEFAYDGGGLAKGADITLYVDGIPAGKGRVDQSIPMGYSADEGLEVGRDLGSPSSPDYGPRNNDFNGTIAWVQLDIGDDDHDHLITPEERFNIAMAKQ